MSIRSWSMLLGHIPSGVMGQARSREGAGWFTPAEIRSSTKLTHLLDKERNTTYSFWPFSIKWMLKNWIDFSHQDAPSLLLRPPHPHFFLSNPLTHIRNLKFLRILEDCQRSVLPRMVLRIWQTLPFQSSKAQTNFQELSFREKGRNSGNPGKRWSVFTGAISESWLMQHTSWMVVYP